MLRRSHIVERTTVSTITVSVSYGARCPTGVAIEKDGNAIIVANTGVHSVIKIVSPQTDNVASTLAGRMKDRRLSIRSRGYRCYFNSPCGVAVDGDGNIIVADMNNHRIRLITPHGQVSTLAGTRTKGHRDGEGSVAQFDSPSGVAVDGDGNIIVADRCNHRIRKITSQGQVSTLAGTGTKGHRDRDEGTVAHFNFPSGIAVDVGGNIIVADSGNHCIRLVTSQGQVSTVAGNGVGGYLDGEGTLAQFNDPFGVAVDGGGNIVVADRGNHRIRIITPQGQVSTLAGTVEDRLHYQQAARDGDGTVAQFNGPSGVTVDGEGNVIVADTKNNCIRCISSGVVIPRRVDFLNYALPPLLQSSFASDLQHHLYFDSGSLHDVCFVVEQEHVHAHRCLLYARCEYFRSMFGAGFKEGDSAEIPIKGTTSAAFKALLTYFYTDDMEVDDAVLFDLAKLCDQYLVERLFNHCVHQLFKGITVHNAVMRLVQAHTATDEGVMWGKLKSATMGYMTHNIKEIWCNARATLELLDRDHPELYKQMLFVTSGIVK